MELQASDMYGNPITPIGETGFGFSAEFGQRADGAVFPAFWLFHISDGFRQTLGALEMDGDQSGRLRVVNIFEDRCAQVDAYVRLRLFSGPMP